VNAQAPVFSLNDAIICYHQSLPPLGKCNGANYSGAWQDSSPAKIENLNVTLGLGAIQSLQLLSFTRRFHHSQGQLHDAGGAISQYANKL